VPIAADDTAIEKADVVLVRHGETVYNRRNLLSGNPTNPVPLSAHGREQSAALGRRLAGMRWAAVYVTRFPRTVETLALVLPHGVPEAVVLPDLDDIDVGEFEGRPREEYRAWRHEHGVGEAPPGGESRLAVTERYARGLAWLAANAPAPSLAVAHDQVVRYLENALQREDPVLGPVGPIPNATPYAYARAELAAAAEWLSAYVDRGGEAVPA
jgi:broad specificity phosphatase PhoE